MSWVSKLFLTYLAGHGNSTLELEIKVSKNYLARTDNQELIVAI